MQPGVRYVIAGAALVLAAIGVHEATRVPPLKEVEVRVHNPPAAFDGYTLLQLTDLHISPLCPAPWTRAVVEGANAAQADLVVITGDLIDGGVAERTPDVAALRRRRVRHSRQPRILL